MTTTRGVTADELRAAIEHADDLVTLLADWEHPHYRDLYAHPLCSTAMELRRGLYNELLKVEKALIADGIVRFAKGTCECIPE